MSVPCKYCPKCQTPAALAAPQCAQCGHVYRTQFQPPPTGPTPQPMPPPASPQGVPASSLQWDPFVFAALAMTAAGMPFMCCCGPVGVAASGTGIVLAVVGLVRISRDPRLKGAPLAWLALGLNVLFLVLYVAGIATALFSSSTG